MKKILTIILITLLVIGSGYLYYQLDKTEKQVAVLKAKKDSYYYVLKHFKKDISKDEFLILADSLNSGIYDDRYLLTNGLGDDIYYMPRGLSQHKKLKYNPFIRISLFNGTVLIDESTDENKSIEQRIELIEDNFYYDQAMKLKDKRTKSSFDEGFILQYPNGFVEKHYTKGNLEESIMTYVDTTCKEWKSKNYPRLNL